ncbi:MAG: nucleotidyltransferase domain-containing protein [Tabrizicola sp.]|nr:nucleotidyltransferase domain-containing protein [Tabrizicola sp.]
MAVASAPVASYFCPMSPHPLIDPVTAALAGQVGCGGLYLSGSHARGTDDAYSDLDLVAIVEPPGQEAFVDIWRGLLDAIAPPVMFRSTKGQAVVLTNAVTEEWDRVDLLLEGADRFSRRARDGLVGLHDPAGLLESLTPAAPDDQALRRRIAWTTEEFIRVLGLLRVGTGREEYVLCIIGAGNLRDHLITLMKAKAGTLGEGALHLSRSVAATDMATLHALPCPVPTRASVVEAHVALAKAFLPRARAAHDRHDIPWPDRFEAATRRKLSESFGAEFDDVW